MIHLSDADQSSLFDVIEYHFDEQSNSQNDDRDSDTDNYPGKLIKFKDHKNEQKVKHTVGTDEEIMNEADGGIKFQEDSTNDII